jgi:hypothetical protein
MQSNFTTNQNNNNENLILSSTNNTNTPFNYYALFLNESSKTDNIYDKYFLRISDDYTSKTSTNRDDNSGFLSFFSNLFSTDSSNSHKKSDLDLPNFDFNSDSDEEKFIVDKQIKHEKTRRLSESDSLYKIKKHHQNNLNQHYRMLTKSEKRELEQEIKKELEYFKLCKAAESKLKQSKLNLITLKELNTLIKRNYTLFSNEQKNDISKVNNLYYSMIFANLLGVTILTSFNKAVCKYYGFLKNRFFLRNVFLTAYFSLTVANNTLYINEYIKKKLVYFPNKIKDKILDKENEKFKVPYDVNMFTYKPEDNKDVFNYI